MLQRNTEALDEAYRRPTQPEDSVPGDGSGDAAPSASPSQPAADAGAASTSPAAAAAQQQQRPAAGAHASGAALPDSTDTGWSIRAVHAPGGLERQGSAAALAVRSSGGAGVGMGPGSGRPAAPFAQRSRSRSRVEDAVERDRRLAELQASMRTGSGPLAGAPLQQQQAPGGVHASGVSARVMWVGVSAEQQQLMERLEAELRCVAGACGGGTFSEGALLRCWCSAVPRRFMAMQRTGQRDWEPGLGHGVVSLSSCAGAAGALDPGVPED